MRYFDAYRMTGDNGTKWLFTRCGECGAVVAEVDQETHTEWHERRADRVGSKEEAEYVAALKAECDSYLGSRQRLPWGPDHPDYDEMGQ
jgi:hypothetical protein